LGGGGKGEHVFGGAFGRRGKLPLPEKSTEVQRNELNIRETQASLKKVGEKRFSLQRLDRNRGELDVKKREDKETKRRGKRNTNMAQDKSHGKEERRRG